MKQGILIGARVGATTWVVYFGVECLLTIILPRFLGTERELLEWQWSLIGLTFVAYLVAGVIQGVVGGVVLKWMGRERDRNQHQIFAGLALAVAFIVNLLSGAKLTGSGEMALAVAAGVGLIFAGSLVWESLQRHTAFVAKPWAVTMLLLAAPWTSHRISPQHSGSVKAMFVASALAVVLVLTAAIHRIPGNRKMNTRQMTLCRARS